jgi:hypothetical protein
MAAKHATSLFVLAICWTMAVSPPLNAQNATRPLRLDALERLATAQNNRMRILEFEATRDAECPRPVGLLYSIGPRLVIIVPHTSADFGGVSLQGAEFDNSREAVFSKAGCRYVLRVQRFEKQNGAEVGLPIFTLAQEVPQRAGNRSSQAKLPVGVSVEKNRIRIDPTAIDPGQLGNTQLSIRFNEPKRKIDFNGMIYFGPKSFTVYLTNVEPELAVDTRFDDAARAHWIDIKNADSRVQLVLWREILSDGTWKKSNP